MKQIVTEAFLMGSKRANSVGRFSIEFEVANYSDLNLVESGLLPADQVRRSKISGLVDSGALRLVLPQAVVRQLGLKRKGKIKVQYANGRTATRETVKGVYLEILGRDGVFTAIVEPRRKDALVGAIVLEDLDFLVDCQNQRLVPRDPNRIISEIECAEPVPG
jgi:predicted aspartyl protease